MLQFFGLHVQADSLSIVSYLLKRFSIGTDICFPLPHLPPLSPSFLPPNKSSANRKELTGSDCQLLEDHLGLLLGVLLLLLLRSDLMGRMEVARELENDGRSTGAKRHPDSCSVPRGTPRQTAKRRKSKDTTNGLFGSAWQVDPATRVCARCSRPSAWHLHVRVFLADLPPTHDDRPPRRSLFGSIDFPILVWNQSLLDCNIYNKPCSSESLLLLPVSQISSWDGDQRRAAGGTDRSQIQQSKVMGETKSSLL